MQKTVATCICEGRYHGAFTYGNKYKVLSHDLEKGQIRICGDNNRTRWYKDYYFDLTGTDALRVNENSWELDGLDGIYEPEEPSNNCEFITVTLSDRGGPGLLDSLELAGRLAEIQPGGTIGQVSCYWSMK